MGDMISFEDFKKLDLRVAEVLEAREHTGADKLHVLKIAIGDETKQIVAGIREQYSPDELVGKKIVIVNNLEPATIRGEESNGMLLAARGDEGPVVLLPEKDVPFSIQS